MNQEWLMQQLQKAIALHNQGDLDKAEVIYRKVLSLDSNNFYALNFCGCILREKMLYEEAIYFLTRAVSLQPGNANANYNLGNVYKNAERWNEAIGCYEQALWLSSEYPEALNNLGICLKQVNRYEHSLIVLQRAVSLKPGFAGAWLNLGNTLIEQDKFSDAIASYRKAIELNPDFAEAYLNLGNVLIEDGQVEEAIVNYRKVIELKPDFAEAYLNLGNVLIEDGQVEEAIVNYRKVIEVKPDFAEAYFNLGSLLNEEGQVEEAIANFCKAIDFKPDFVEAYLNLANVLKEDGQVEEAIVNYRKVIEVKPDFAEAYFYLGNLLKEDCQVEEAIANYLKAIEVKSDFAIAWSAVAQSLMDSGRVSDGIAAFEKCFQLNDWDPSYYERSAFSCDEYACSFGDSRLFDVASHLYKKSFQVRPLISSFSFIASAHKVNSVSSSTLLQALPGNAELLPSYMSIVNQSPLSLYYLHIPKNGGIRFTIPLQECIRAFENSLFDGSLESWRNRLAFEYNYKRLTALRLNNKSIHVSVLDVLSSYSQSKDIDWSLIMSHGSWSSLELQKLIADVAGQMPIRIGAWREPRERFLSALQYLYREADGSVERVRNDLSERIPFLHNPMYRYVVDCFEKDLPDSPHELADDYLIELGDHSLLNRIQSSFLSRNRLPNLIVSKRFNVTKSDFRMSKEEEASLLAEFSIDEFVHLDESRLVDSLRVSVLPPELDFEPLGDELHPLTVVVSDSTGESYSVYATEIMLTSELIGENGKQKLKALFAGKNDWSP